MFKNLKSYFKYKSFKYKEDESKRKSLDALIYEAEMEKKRRRELTKENSENNSLINKTR